MCYLSSKEKFAYWLTIIIDFSPILPADMRNHLSILESIDSYDIFT